VTRGRLIAFEGVEGAGKSTQIATVASTLRDRGDDVVLTREPGGTKLGTELRRIVMEAKGTPPTPLAELLLYIADRAQHIEQVIRPALQRGSIVLTDRFSASTIAYQGYARGLDLELVRHLDALARAGVQPDLTVLLDCPVAIGLPRARGNDRFHREESRFHERVRAGFLELARQAPDFYCVVDTTQERDIVTAQVLAGVIGCLSKD